MDGIGLNNMMGIEEVEKFFASHDAEPEDVGNAAAGEETPANEENNDTQEETAEVDVLGLLSNQPESVGSGNDSEGNGDSPESTNGPGTPQANLFSSIAKAMRDEGVFPDLSDDELNGVKDAQTLRKLFDDQTSKMLDERQKRLEKALDNGATTSEVQQYQQAMNLSEFLDSRDTYDTLTQESQAGEELRRKVIYQDYINRGFKHEDAVKRVQRSFDGGYDMEDAKAAFDSCKDFYRRQIENFQQEMEERKRQQKANEEKQFSSLKKRILDTESFYDGVKVDRRVRQKAYDSITKPVSKDEDGNYINELQKYQRENPMEFMENVALLYALTDGFKNVEKLTSRKVQAGIKKGFEEVASVLNSTRRNGDGTLNLANTAPDDSERENWTLA